jgi:transcriptional regulator with XRE-family HTH domain
VHHQSNPARPASRLAEARRARGVTQDDLARAIGISLPTYRRLETGRMPNPPLRYLANCAIALGVQVEELIEDDWREWLVFDHFRASKPPDPKRLWRASE